ncbi:DUF2752 domain-containing protein [Viscerimonas tarda]
MRKYIVISLAVIVPLVIAYFYYAHYTGDRSSFSIQCGFHALTGFQCPGCGGQRAVHYLLHGHLLNALRYNALFVLGLPALLYMYYILVAYYGLKKDTHLNGFFYSSLCARLALIAIISFFILRNIPLEPFIYLSPPR